MGALKAAPKEDEVSIKDSLKGTLVLDYLKKYKGYGHKTIARAYAHITQNILIL